MKIIVGGKGRMGQLIAKTAEEHGHTVIGLFDAFCLDELKAAQKADMVIDFSHRDNLEWICDYVNENNAALVYGTTGLSEEQKEKLLAFGFSEDPACYRDPPVFLRDIRQRGWRRSRRSAGCRRGV